MSVHTILRATNDEIVAIKKWQGQTTQDLSKDVKYLKIWLSQQAHLPQDINDIYLEKLLRINKFSLEKTKNKIDMYFSMKNLVPEFFDNRDLLAPKMQFHLNNVIFCPLPQLTSDFSRVYIFNFCNNNSEHFDLIQHVKYLFATADLRFFFDDCLTDTYIIDMKNCTMGHVVKHNPVIVKKGYTVMVKGYSDRLKGIHFVNLPNCANILVNLANTLLNEKMSKRVYVHKDYTSLHKIISKDILPIEYGGREKSLTEINDDWRKLLEDNNSWLMEMGEKRSNEKLRKGDSLTEDIFGSIHGSFRQLEVD